MDPLTIASLAGGAIKGITGLIQKGQAKKWLKNNPQVIEGMQREYLQNQGVAQNMANAGLPSQVYNNAMKNIRRQQLTALSYAGDRRGALTALPGITMSTNDAMADLDARDAAARQENQRYAIGVNNQVAGIKRDLYDLNIRKPYERKRDEMMGQMGAGNQNLVGGLDQIASAGVGLTRGGFGGSGRSGRGGLTAGYGADFDNYGMDW